MKPDWTTETIITHFTLQSEERAWLGSNEAHNHLGKALQLKFFQYEGRFAEGLYEIPEEAIAYVAQQLHVAEQIIGEYEWRGRTAKDHRRDVRKYLGFRPVTAQDKIEMREWIKGHVLPEEYRPSHIRVLLYAQLRTERIEPPSQQEIDRVIASALVQYQRAFFERTYAKLPQVSRLRLRNLLSEASSWTEQLSGYPLLHEIKLGPGAADVKHIHRVCERLKYLRAIELPEDLFEGIPMKYLRQYQRQVSVESPSHLLRREENQPEQMYTLLATFCWVRQREVTDDLVDLFIRVLKDIKVRAEHKEEKRVLNDFIRVDGKQQLLFNLSEAMLAHPDGVIKEILYPIVGEARLKALVKEAKQTGPFQRAVQTRIGSSYSHHYRQILPPLLEVLKFRSNNARHRPLIDALKIVKTYLEDEHRTFYPMGTIVPMQDVIPPAMQSWIWQPNRSGNLQVRRTRYELCVLQGLRDQLRSKEIWVVGADRYRNPDEDTPVDYADKRVEYYHALNLPLDADEFIKQIQQEMTQALKQFHDGLLLNPYVTISSSGRIGVKKLDKKKQTANLTYLHNQVKQVWGLVSLLDILKEVDLRVDFTQHFKSLTGESRLSPDVLQRRLLLCLYGLGTNTGLSRVWIGNPDVSESNLKYVRRRFISVEGLRVAIAHVVNELLAIKAPHIWGDLGTWSASDSKQFGSWDQNLRAQWHQRYRQSGVMVYWHVSKQSLCIYSQLKAPSSSEVASMIEGVIRHCTAMQVDRNYVDTHGQSEVGFAFCRLLGFQLMPRLKNIYEQKLHVPYLEDFDKYPALAPILKSVIDWDLIRQQYDEMVKYATALRLGTAQTEAILKRFTRHNIHHPTYKAFSELGRAIKTIFLCRYLHDVDVRQEIFDGLQVIENWNSANGFIFYGNQGDIASNDVNAQEITILAMHLLQTSMTYINTLIVQQVLAEPSWYNRFTDADWRGLTPLFYKHINPYGSFNLDMASRIPLAS
ncbi:MAG: Tn3 family transposase [Chloroflexi bacterium]|nr:MAG: Tn3 family transposase [Chloroflexota bacterium]